MTPQVPNYDQEPMVLVFKVRSGSIILFLVDYIHTYSSIYKRQVQKLFYFWPSYALIYC